MLSHWVKIPKKLFLFGCFFILIFLSCNKGKLYAQDPFAKIAILKGSNAIFSVSTLDQIINGVTLSNWSKVQLYFNNSSCTGWELTISADNVALVSATDSIPLSSLLIEPVITNQIGEPNLQVSSPSFSPTTADIWVLKGDGTSNVFIEFSLTYKLGTTAPLLSFDSGYYIVGLSFNLTPINYIP